LFISLLFKGGGKKSVWQQNIGFGTQLWYKGTRKNIDLKQSFGNFRKISTSNQRIANQNHLQ